jgi:hypothetical protein
MTVIFSRRRWLGCALSALSVTLAAPLQAADLSWKGIGAARSPAGWSIAWGLSLLALRRRQRSREQPRALQARPHPNQAEHEPPYAPK